MIEPYFGDEEISDLCRKELREWVGTPFFARSKAKGRDGGVDCVNLVQEVYFNLGAIDAKHEMPKYPLSWHLHNANCLLYEFMDKFHGHDFVVIDVEDPIMTGDMLCFTPTGKVAHHAAIATTTDKMVHALRSFGVIETQIRGTDYGLKLDRIYRPIKL